MTPGYAKTRSQLPHLYYPKADTMRVINAHSGGGALPAEDGIKRNNTFAGYTSGSQTVSASSELASSYQAWKAVNGAIPPGGTEDNWIGANGDIPAWIKIDFGSTQAIYSVGIVARAAPQGLLADFSIQSSADDATWESRLDVTGETWSSSHGWRHDYDLDTPAEARYWRIYVTTGGSSNRAEINEMEWYS